MTPPPAVDPVPLARGPFVLLGLMTATTILGPVIIGVVLRGGPRPHWPPDRVIEWATVLGVSAAVIILMVACVALLWTNRPPIKAGSDRAPAPPNPAEVGR